MSKYHLGIAALLLSGLTLVVLATNGFFEGARARLNGGAPLGGSDSVDSNGTASQGPAVDLADALGTGESEFEEVGGVMRPTRDLQYDKAITRRENAPSSVLPSSGHIAFLKGDENSQVAGLMKEITAENPGNQDRELLAAKSTLFRPEPFDSAEYEANPQEYLKKIRPGRVFQPAQPGPDVKRLTALSPPFAKVLQGESITLRVQAEKGVPVSFYAQEPGVFADNRLKSLTIAADENGVAEAQFTLGRGVAGLVRVLAASPQLSDQVQYTFKVVLPE